MLEDSFVGRHGTGAALMWTRGSRLMALPGGSDGRRSRRGDAFVGARYAAPVLAPIPAMEPGVHVVLDGVRDRFGGITRAPRRVLPDHDCSRAVELRRWISRARAVHGDRD